MQRLKDMTQLEVRTGGEDAAWEPLRTLAPDLVAQLTPNNYGLRDERELIAWALHAGIIAHVRVIHPKSVIAFRLSGQYRDAGGWELTDRGTLLVLQLFGAAA